MKSWKFVSLLSFASLLMASPQANAALISLDFDGLPAMVYVSGTPIPSSARLSDTYVSTYGVSFTSGSAYAAVVNLGAGHATSGTNGLGGSTQSGTLTYDRSNPIVATFYDPTNPTTKGVTDFVSLRVDLGGDSRSITLNAYGIAGNLLASSTAVDTGGATLDVTAPGIHSVQFLGTTDIGGAAVDDFKFHAVSSVPEPQTSILFGVGIMSIFLNQFRRAKRGRRNTAA